MPGHPGAAEHRWRPLPSPAACKPPTCCCLLVSAFHQTHPQEPGLNAPLLLSVMGVPWQANPKQTLPTPWWVHRACLISTQLDQSDELISLEIPKLLIPVFDSAAQHPRSFSCFNKPSSVCAIFLILSYSCGCQRSGIESCNIRELQHLWQMRQKLMTLLRNESRDLCRNVTLMQNNMKLLPKAMSKESRDVYCHHDIYPHPASPR